MIRVFFRVWKQNKKQNKTKKTTIRWSPRGVVVYVLDYDIVVSEFEL